LLLLLAAAAAACKSRRRASQHVRCPRIMAKKSPHTEPKKVSGSWTFLIFCTLGIYSCYLYYGFLMERLAHECYCPDPSNRTCCIESDGTKSPTWRYNYVSLVLQCVVAALVARVACCLSPQPDTGYQQALVGRGVTGRVPWHKYAVIGFSYVGAMFLGQKSLQFISFPTQVIVKSCKMVPVMVAGALFHNKKYSAADYIRVLMVTVGIVVFTFFKDGDKAAKAKHGAEMSLWTEVFGLLLAFSSLVCDAFVSPNQQAVTEKYKSSPYQNMYYSNMWGLVVPLCLMLWAGELQPAAAAVMGNSSLLFDLACFGLLSAAGQVFIFLAMDSFGSLTLVTITTTRKFFTVLGSIVVYKHSVSAGQVAGMLMVFGGLAWKELSHAMSKDKDKKH
jgi:solute carrier family 35 (UDP-galactose transporter), member B1